jgi:hypothetical protein
MSWASYQDMCDEIPVIVPEPVVCIECEVREPEDGCDHCQRCLDTMNEAAWDTVYGAGSPVSESQRLQDDMRISGAQQ